MLIDMGEAEGTVEATQGEMLEKIFRFGETEVREVMTPRPDIVWVNADTRFGEFLEIYRNRPHTRFSRFRRGGGRRGRGAVGERRDGIAGRRQA